MQEEELQKLKTEEERNARRKQFLHLFRLVQPIRLTSTCIDLVKAGDGSLLPAVKFIPSANTAEFLTFPFTEILDSIFVTPMIT